MAAATIKGITIEIGGNTQKLEQALSGVTAKGRDLQSELNSINRLLKLDPTSTVLLAQKQQVLKEAISNTESKLKSLKEAEKQAQEQFKKGEISEEQYRALQREVAGTEQKLNGYKAELEQVEQQSKETADATGKIGDEAKKSSEESKGFSGKAVAAFAAVTAAVTAAVASMSQVINKIKEAATAAAAYADDINTMAAKYRVSAESLQKFGYAADIVDVSVETFGSSLGKLTKNIGNAQKGTKDQAEAFKGLGVSIYDSNGKLRSSEDVFYDVIDALGKMDDETQADIYSSRLFGRSFQELNPLVSAGTDKLKSLGSEAEKVGYVLGDDALSSLNDFQDSLDRMKSMTDTATRAFSIGMAPALKEITDAINEKLASPAMQASLKKMGEAVGEIAKAFADFAMFIVENGEIIGKILLSIGAGFVAWKIASVIQSLGGLKAALMTVISAIKGMGTAITAATSATVIGAIVSVIAIIASLSESLLGASDAAEDFKGEMKTLKDDANAMKTDFTTTQETLALNGDTMRSLVDDIQALDEKIKSGNLSASQMSVAQGELAAKTAQYNSAAGEEVLKIDATTGSIDGGTSALQKNTEAIIENTRRAAALSALQDAYKTQTEAQAKQAAWLDEIGTHYDDLSDDQKKYIDQMKKEGVSLEALSNLWYASPIWGGQVNNEIRGIIEGIEDSIDAEKSAGEQIDFLNGVVGENSKVEASRSEVINDQTKAVEELTDAQAAQYLSMQTNGQALTEAQQAQLEAYKTNNEERYASLQELVQNEKNAYDARVQAATDMNNKIDESNQVSLQQATENLQANTDIVTQFTSDLDSLYGRIPDSVYNALQAAGVNQSVLVSDLAQRMANGGDEVSQAFIDSYTNALASGMSQTDAAAYAIGAGTQSNASGGIATNPQTQNEAAAMMDETAASMEGKLIGGNRFFNVGMDIINQLAQGMMTVKDTLYYVIDGIVGTIKDKFTINVSASGTASGATVRPFATGGIVTRPTLGLVGEAGAEAIIPLDKLGSVIQDSLRGVGGGGSMTVYVQPQEMTQAQTDYLCYKLDKMMGAKA